MNQLPSELIKQFQEALCHAFPTVPSFRQMARYALGENLDKIAGGETVTEISFNLIQYAESHGKIQELIDGALTENPDNPALNEFHTAWTDHIRIDIFEPEQPADIEHNSDEFSPVNSETPSVGRQLLLLGSPLWILGIWILGTTVFFHYLIVLSLLVACYYIVRIPVADLASGLMTIQPTVKGEDSHSSPLARIRFIAVIIWFIIRLILIFSILFIIDLLLFQGNIIFDNVFEIANTIGQGIMELGSLTKEILKQFAQ